MGLALAVRRLSWPAHGRAGGRPRASCQLVGGELVHARRPRLRAGLLRARCAPAALARRVGLAGAVGSAVVLADGGRHRDAGRHAGERGRRRLRGRRLGRPGDAGGRRRLGGSATSAGRAGHASPPRCRPGWSRNAPGSPPTCTTWSPTRGRSWRPRRTAPATRSGPPTATARRRTPSTSSPRPRAAPSPTCATSWPSCATRSRRPRRAAPPATRWSSGCAPPGWTLRRGRARHAVGAGPLAVTAQRLLAESLTNALKHGDLGHPVEVEEDWRDGYRLVVRNRVRASLAGARHRARGGRDAGAGRAGRGHLRGRRRPATPGRSPPSCRRS